MRKPTIPSANRAAGGFGITLPRVSSAKRARATELFAALLRAYPDAHCELNYSSPHELLVATILSAQATDVSVNKATPALFARFPQPVDYSKATPAQIEPYIKTIGLFRNKAKSVHAAMTTLVERFDSRVPEKMEDLLTLRGVARKTANVVLGNCFGVNVGVVVDTHVHRLARRLGLVPANANVAEAERWLMASFPREQWCTLSHLLIFHGRGACKARGAGCAAHEVCDEYGGRCELRVSAKGSKSRASTPAQKLKRPASQRRAT